MNTNLPVYQNTNHTSSDVPIIPSVNCPCVMGLSSSVERRPSQDASLFSDQSGSRPMHFIRRASINPPAFDAEVPPPPLATPPPGYDTLTPLETRDGWEYFWGTSTLQRPTMPPRTVTTRSEQREMGSNDQSDDSDSGIDEDAASIIIIDQELMVRVPTDERRESYT
jgi:hypothetical protein